jgi:pimeloyl-ACP methyl ester carboxylesterase
LRPAAASAPLPELDGGPPPHFFRDRSTAPSYLFTARTMVRSRQHRLLLAAYAGVGLALALADVKTLIYVTFILPGYSALPFSQPNTSLAAASLAFLFFAVIGTRAPFALPAELRANWIFVPSAYFAAVRKSLSMVIVAPVWTGAAIFYLALWPAGAALEHLAALGMAGVLLIQKSLREFRKIPFACSYLPGKSNLNVKLGAYAIGFLVANEAFVHLELWSMDDVVRFTLFAAALTAFALRARSQTAEFAGAPSVRIQFEDTPDAVVHALDLRRDGAWSSEQAYVDAIDRHFGRSLAVRLRPFVLALGVLACCGFLWEVVCERLDNWRFPQVGRSVDIGGRKLNLFCSGEGTPTVILESGWTAPGYSWVRVQREIAAITKTCWYDRAGYGWSDPGPNPHWSDSAARDLHTLLQRAQLTPPYVLVGASLGGLNVQVYNGLYRGEATGMVLVDTALTDASRMPDLPKRAGPPRATAAANLFLAAAIGRLGFYRLTASPEDRPKTYTPVEWDLISNLKSRWNARLAWMKEYPIEASADIAASQGKIDDLPLIVLTAGRSLRPAQQKIWNELQAELAGRSRRGEQIVVQNSGHDIPSQYPEPVVDAVRKVAAETRRSMK